MPDSAETASAGETSAPPPAATRWRQTIDIAAESAERAADLKRHLFGIEDQSRVVYAVLDAAGVPNLPTLLAEQGIPNCCLFSGKLEPGVAENAPYLVELDREDALVEQLVVDGWGQSWGIYATLTEPVGFRAVRRHFRTFLRVRGPEGKVVFFRYYDPRIMRLYLPTCTEDELETILGPVATIYLESDGGEKLFAFSRSSEPETPSGTKERDA